MMKKSYNSQWQGYLERLKTLRFMDDDFMVAVFQKHACTELLIRILMDRDDLIVKNVSVQKEFRNLEGRTVKLDIFAEDAEGKVYDIEIQRSDKGAGRQRARYNSSLMDSHTLDHGDEFDDLPESHVIFITESDILKGNLPIYHIDRIIRETGEEFRDGSHIIYVNSLIQNDTALGRLMHDFHCTNPDEMKYKILADEARYYKETEGGQETMCRAFEEVKNEGIEQGIEQTRIDTAIKMLKEKAFGLDLIAKISDLPLEKVEELAKGLEEK